MTISAESLLTTFLSECPMVRLTETERRKLHNLFQTALDKPWQKMKDGEWYGTGQPAPSGADPDGYQTG